MCDEKTSCFCLWECVWLNSIVCLMRFWCGKCRRTCPALLADSAIYFVNVFFFLDVLNVLLSTSFCKCFLELCEAQKTSEYWLTACSISLTTICMKLELIFTISCHLIICHRHLLLYSACSEPGSEDSGSHSLTFIIGMFYINRTLI